VIIQCTKKKIFYKSFHIINPVKNDRVDANIFYNAIFYSIHPIKNPTKEKPQKHKVSEVLYAFSRPKQLSLCEQKLSLA